MRRQQRPESGNNVVRDVRRSGEGLPVRERGRGSLHGRLAASGSKWLGAGVAAGRRVEWDTPTVGGSVRVGPGVGGVAREPDWWRSGLAGGGGAHRTRSGPISGVGGLDRAEPHSWWRWWCSNGLLTCSHGCATPLPTTTTTSAVSTARSLACFTRPSWSVRSFGRRFINHRRLPVAPPASAAAAAASPSFSESSAYRSRAVLTEQLLPLWRAAGRGPSATGSRVRRRRRRWRHIHAGHVIAIVGGRETAGAFRASAQRPIWISGERGRPKRPAPGVARISLSFTVILLLLPASSIIWRHGC